MLQILFLTIQPAVRYCISYRLLTLSSMAYSIHGDFLVESEYKIIIDIMGCFEKLWDEVGESDAERDKMRLQLEQECLDVYKRKVDQPAKSRAPLLQALADAKLELSVLVAFKRQGELEDIFAQSHVEIDSQASREKILAFFDSGDVDPSYLLAHMDTLILKAKEEAFSRKDIIDKVDEWMSACEKESWLDDYNRDDNRYNGSRCAHLYLKRAENARILVNKIPALVDTLVAKTRAWEEEHGHTFAYDGVPLIAMLDEYALLRHDREVEKPTLQEEAIGQKQKLQHFREYFSDLTKQIVKRCLDYLNTMDYESLRLLPRIGTSVAPDILKLRTETPHPFQLEEDLNKILNEGMARRMLKDLLRDLIE